MTWIPYVRHRESKCFRELFLTEQNTEDWLNDFLQYYFMPADGSLPMTGDLDMGDYDINNVGVIHFDLDATHTHSEGSIHWNDDDKTLNVDTEVADTSIQVGQEVVLRCTNKTASPITNGSVVYISGAQGNRPTITLADADTEATAITTIGIATHEIAVNATGYVTTFGLVRDINTNSFTEGDCLFLSQTAGGLRNSAPPPPAYRIQVAKCIYKHATEGVILVDVDAASHPSIPVATCEPTGFENRTDSNIDFDDGSRTFTVEPAVDEFITWHCGTKIIHDSALTSQISDTEGMWYFYIDADGALQNKATFTNDLVESSNCLVAMVYWDATNKEAVGLGDERHGIKMDGKTHVYLHNTVGARWSSGGSFGDITADGAGDSADHATISVADVITYDEDIEHDSTDSWITQDLTSPAQIQVLYLDGAAANWRSLGTNYYPVADDAKVGEAGAHRLYYNTDPGGGWQLTEVTSGKFVLAHIFATNSVTAPVVAIVGQNEYASKNAAYTGSTDELATLYTTGLPMVEFVPLGTIIYQTSDSYTNAPKARIITTEDGGNYIDWRVATPTRSLGLGVVDDGRFFLLGGRTGGQTAYGSTVASENLTLSSTAGTPKGKIIFGTSSAYDEVNDRLGIGTASPSTKFVVYDDGSENTVFTLNARGTDTSTKQASTNMYGARNGLDAVFANLSFNNYDSNGTSADFVGANIRALNDGADDARLEFQTATNKSCTTKITIKNDGKVGVGISSPLGKLHIVDGTSTGQTPSSVNALVVDTTDSDDGISILSANGETAYLAFGDAADNFIGALYYQHSNNAMKLFVNNADRMIIDSSGNVGIGTTSPDASAKLDITSTTQGFLPPRVTTTQKGNISSPATGLVVYDTDLNKLCVYTGSGWETVTSS